MPNWVFNSLSIDGNKEDIAKVKAQLNQPYSRYFDTVWNAETNKHESANVTYSNPVFAFWNIIKPTDLEAYHKQTDFTSDKPYSGEDWYSWNNRNWGTKWDVAISDGEEYPETELSDEGETFLSYRFNTAWGIPNEALITLSSQYPDLSFTLEFEEETGWGGEYEYKAGECLGGPEYNWKCFECDYLEINDPEVNYCEDCEDFICPSCGGAGGVVEFCDKHKEEANA